MADQQDALLNAFNTLDGAVNDLTNSEAAGAAEIASLAEMIKNIPPGTALTADQLSGLAQRATSAAEAMNDAVTAAQQPVDTSTQTPSPEPGSPPPDEQPQPGMMTS